jgi:hypothetical protein
MCMLRYFELVCLNDPKFLLAELCEGRARFGWSPPKTDLREIRKKDRSSWSDQEKETWRYTKFLIQRINPGDRIVVQMEQPIERLVIAEVVEPGYDFTPGNLRDFNHVLHVRPVSSDPIPINSKDVSLALKHDLSKRGHYYEVYPESSLLELDNLVEKASSGAPSLLEIRTDEDNRDRTLRAAKGAIVREVKQQWQTHDFELFCEMLCNSLEYLEVKERKDRGKGWDLMIRIVNPLTQTILLDDLPVQCKNYTGRVTTIQPIDDLERCIRNSDSDRAFLFIVGDLTDEFLRLLRERQEKLSRELGREVTFEVIDQDRIAELYARCIDQSAQRSS